jgi:hypothetical protein
MKTLHYSRRRNPEEEVTDEEEISTPLAFGDVAYLEEDGLTDEQRKRALTWLKKRAERTEGVFDAEDAHLAISLLPGWSSKVLTTTRAVSLNSTTSGSSFPVALVEAGLTHDTKPGNRSPSLGEPGYRESNIVGVRAVGYYDDPRIIADTAIAATFREYDPKKVKVKSLPAGRWATSIRGRGDGTATIEKPTIVFAEQGGLEVTNPEGVTETAKAGKSAWTAFYGTRDRNWKYSGGLGMVAAAQAILPSLEQKVETRAAFTKSNERAWGGALCPVCFQRAAVTPTSQHMVDHRHTRPGYGYNVAPCEGNRFAPYMLSPEGSAWMLQNLEAVLPRKIEKLRIVIANPTKQVYSTKVNVRDERGDIVYDLVPPNKARYRGEKKERMEVEPVTYGHKLYAEKYERHVKTLKAELAATRNAIPFYAAAVRVWKKGLDEMEPILRGVRETDKPALPPDLRNNPRRRAATVPRRENGFLASLALVGIGMAAGVYVEEKQGIAARVRSSLKGKDKTAREQFDRLKRGVLEAKPKTSPAPMTRAAPVTDATWSVEEEMGGKGNLHTRRIAGLEYVVFERSYGKGRKSILLDVFDLSGKPLPRIPGGEGDDGEGWKTVAAAKKAAEKHAHM